MICQPHSLTIVSYEAPSQSALLFTGLDQIRQNITLNTISNSVVNQLLIIQIIDENWTCILIFVDSTKLFLCVCMCAYMCACARVHVSVRYYERPPLSCLYQHNLSYNCLLACYLPRCRINIIWEPVKLSKQVCYFSCSLHCLLQNLKLISLDSSYSIPKLPASFIFVHFTIAIQLFTWILSICGELFS